MAENSKKQAVPELVWLALGELAVCGIIVAVYLIIGKFSWKVVTGALLGAAVGLVNQALLTVMAGKAFDKAAKERGTDEMTEEEIQAFKSRHERNVKSMITLSFIIRMVLLVGTLLLIFLLPAVFEPIPAVIALAAVSVLIILVGLLKKKI